MLPPNVIDVVLIHPFNASQCAGTPRGGNLAKVAWSPANVADLFARLLR